MSDSRTLAWLYDMKGECLGDFWLRVLPRVGDIVELVNEETGVIVSGQVAGNTHQITSLDRLYPKHTVAIRLVNTRTSARKI